MKTFYLMDPQTGPHKLRVDEDTWCRVRDANWAFDFRRKDFQDMPDVWASREFFQAIMGLKGAREELLGIVSPEHEGTLVEQYKEGIGLEIWEIRERVSMGAISYFQPGESEEAYKVVARRIQEVKPGLRQLADIYTEAFKDVSVAGIFRERE